MLFSESTDYINKAAKNNDCNPLKIQSACVNTQEIKQLLNYIFSRWIFYFWKLFLKKQKTEVLTLKPILAITVS